MLGFFGVGYETFPFELLGILHSGSLAIISKRVGLDRVLSEVGGGGDIGFKSPAVRAELKLVKEDGNVSWWLEPAPYTAVVVVIATLSSFTGESEDKITDFSILNDDSSIKDSRDADTAGESELG